MAIDGDAAWLIRQARERRGYSQRALAGFAHTTQSVIGRIEAGKVSPSVGTIVRLAAAAGFDVRMELVPQRVSDPVVEAYKAGVDRTLLVENLRRTVEERLRMNADVVYFTDEMRRSLRVAEPKP